MAAIVQRAQGLSEWPLQPGEVVGLAVMVRRELVGPPDRGVPDVFAGTLDERSDVADAFGVGHRPVTAAGDVDRRGVRENPATPFIEVIIDAERSAGYPRVPVDPQFLVDFGLPSAGPISSPPTTTARPITWPGWSVRSPKPCARWTKGAR